MFIDRTKNSNAMQRSLDSSSVSLTFLILFIYLIYLYILSVNNDIDFVVRQSGFTLNLIKKTLEIAPIMVPMYETLTKYT